MIILACILARFNFQDHVNLRSAHSGCSSTVYIVQLACLEHAESTRRSHRDDSVLMRRLSSSLQNSDVPRAVNWNQHNGAFRKRAWTLFGTYPDLDLRFLPGIYQVPWPSTAMRLRGCHWHDQGFLPQCLWGTQQLKTSMHLAFREPKLDLQWFGKSIFHL